jgi:4-diphosphocytidyl-2-C-methyl-D-erythritol kinase
VVRVANAKLNLTLAVVGTRPDGYHDLHSVMVRLTLHDRLSLAPAAGRSDSITVVSADPTVAIEPGDLPTDADNLVLRAIAVGRSALGRAAEAWPLAVRLEKAIPIAAGLGGGSSDAAAALDGALEAWGAAAELSVSERMVAAARVGSDVPFFLANGPAVIEGRGERVTPLPAVKGPPPGVLLVTPAIAASTPAVFAAYDGGGSAAPADRGSTRASSEHLAAELRGGLSAADLLVRAGVLAVANDLANAAAQVAPGLRELRRSLTRLLGVPIGLSGSGPTLWALYPSQADAADAAIAVAKAADDDRLPSAAGRRPRIIATAFEAASQAQGG